MFLLDLSLFSAVSSLSVMGCVFAYSLQLLNFSFELSESCGHSFRKELLNSCECYSFEKTVRYLKVPLGKLCGQTMISVFCANN